MRDPSLWVAHRFSDLTKPFPRTRFFAAINGGKSGSCIFPRPKGGFKAAGLHKPEVGATGHENCGGRQVPSGGNSQLIQI